MKVRYSVLFNRRSRLKKNGKGNIEISCYLSSKSSKTNKYFHYTGIDIYPNEWSKSFSEVNKHNANKDELNERIKNTHINLEKFELKKFKENNYFELSFFKDFDENQLKAVTFVELINDWKNNDKTVSADTKRQYNNLVDRLIEFRGENISINQIDINFVKGFDNYLYSKDFAINTIAKFHKNFKKFLKIAIDKGLFSRDANPYLQFKAKKENTKKDFLTLTELKMFENMDVSIDPSLHLIKIMFLFSCYTGLRYSDVKKVSKNDFDVEGDIYKLRLKAKKTKKYDVLPISSLFNNKVSVILKEVWKEDGSFLFGDFSNQYVNRRLKDLSEHHKIEKKITYHMSRHTFGTILAQKFSSSVVGKFMQHSKPETTNVYIHLSTSALDKLAKDVDWD